MSTETTTTIRFARPCGRFTVGLLKAVPEPVAVWLVAEGVADLYTGGMEFVSASRLSADQPLRIGEHR